MKNSSDDKRNDPGRVGPPCPKCGSEKVVKIVYGLPERPGVPANPDDWTTRRVLGGCVIRGDDPEWACTDCAHRFGTLKFP